MVIQVTVRVDQCPDDQSSGLRSSRSASLSWASQLELVFALFALAVPSRARGKPLSRRRDES